MRSLDDEVETARPVSVEVTDDTISVELDDGRSVSVPTAWYPRLLHATRPERSDYELSDDAVVWPSIEADFSVRGILLGRKSGESPESFAFLLEYRKKGRRVTLIDYVKHRRKAATSKPRRSA